MSDTRNLGRKQRTLLLELEQQPWMLIWRGRTLPGAPRYVWTETGRVAKARTIEPLFDRGLIACEETGRGKGELRVVLTSTGLAWVAQYWRERADARRDMYENWRNRAHELEARIKELGG